MAYTPMVLLKPAIMQWNNNKITDHNRSPLSVSVERIELASRMANGTLRKYVIADKRRFSMSWENLPHNAGFTVDGFWGGREMEVFYNTTSGGFTLKLTNGDGTVETYTVVMSNFSKEIRKRGEYDMWDVDVELEEV
jgi:hypothetical protein